MMWCDVKNKCHIVSTKKDYRTYNEKEEDEFIGEIFRNNCLPRHGTEGTTEGRLEFTERRGRGRRQLLDDFQDSRGEDTDD